MFRSEALKLIQEDRPWVSHDEALDILNLVEYHLDMKPPRLPEAHCQALMDVYYGGYNFYQWEEDFAKDEKAVEALKRRQSRKN
jgi:hypothetical protein